MIATTPSPVPYLNPPRTSPNPTPAKPSPLTACSPTLAPPQSTSPNVAPPKPSSPKPTLPKPSSPKHSQPKPTPLKPAPTNTHPLAPAPTNPKPKPPLTPAPNTPARQPTEPTREAPTPTPTPTPTPSPTPKEPNPAHEFGRRGEDLVTAYVKDVLGLIVLCRNWRCREGEIDILATDGDMIVVCEVKTRTSNEFGTPADAMNAKKIRRIKQATNRWLREYRIPYVPLRYDLAEVWWPRTDDPHLQYRRDAF